jgi:hypothetical protein
MDYSSNWIITANDTIQFEDAGPYYMGTQLNSGPGFNWHPYIGNCPDNSDGSGCLLPAFLNGVKVYGFCHLTGSCHTAWSGANPISGLAPYTPTNLTQLVGINDEAAIFQANGSSGVDIEGFDMTSYDECTLKSAYGPLSHVTLCVAGTNNYAQTGILFNYLTGSGPTNITVKDIAIHGMAFHGTLGSHFNTTGTDTSTFDYITIAGNGLDGFDSDGGGCGTSCESVGTLNFSHVYVTYNGCMEVKPNGGTIGGNGYDMCIGQSGGNGNGDGIVMIATGGTWHFSDIATVANVQDGFDGLHIGDDLVVSPTLTLDRVWSISNAGQAIKTGGDFTIRSSVGVGNCEYLANPHSPNPTYYNFNINTTNDICRAAGDQEALEMLNGRSGAIYNSTFWGYGDTMFDIECVSGQTCTTGTQLTFVNVVSMGFTRPATGLNPGGLYFGAPDPFQNPGSIGPMYSLWYQMKNNTCPQDATTETNFLCTDPKFVNESNVDTLNPRIQASSPAYHSGVACSGCPTTDYLGNAYSVNPSRGAFEYVAPPFTSRISGKARLAGKSRTQ